MQVLSPQPALAPWPDGHHPVVTPLSGSCGGLACLQATGDYGRRRKEGHCEEFTKLGLLPHLDEQPRSRALSLQSPGTALYSIFYSGTDQRERFYRDPINNNMGWLRTELTNTVTNRDTMGGGSWDLVQSPCALPGTFWTQGEASE